MKVRMLADERTATAFMLAGIRGRIIKSKEEALADIRESKDVAIFLVMAEFYPTGYSEPFPILVRVPRRR